LFDPLSEFSHVPLDDSEIPPAAASTPPSSDGPVPWLLVPGPVAGIERLRADRELTLTRSLDDIGSDLD
jgi:hypothetical protein